jgi:hypothetical protein
MRRPICGFAVLLVVLAIVAGPVRADIDTTGLWNGTDHVFPFGWFDTATYGQTFAVGSDNVLKDFTFYLAPYLGGDTHFRGYVMAWDTATVRATGPVLYESADMVAPASSSGFLPYTASMGSLALTSGQEYVAFFSASKLFGGVEGLQMCGAPYMDSYSAGSFVYMNNGSDFGALTTTYWNVWYGDLAFNMHFESVPEPAFYQMAGLLALGGLGALRMRRRAAK